MLNTTTYPFQLQFQHDVQQAYLDNLRLRERAKMEEYIRSREYYDGIHNSALTDRVRQFLDVSRDADFTVNYCPMVVNAKADRLQVTGFSVEDDDTLSEQLWSWWRKNRMDRLQGIVHRSAIRDGDTFVLVEWDDVANMPRFYYEPAFAGDGVMVYYSEERRNEIEFASKSWRIEHGRTAGKARRLNLYFANRIEKYISNDDTAKGRYMPYTEDDDTELYDGHLGTCAVHWWTDNGTESGQPLGVPIVHFKHDDSGDEMGTSHIAKVIPLQDALNKTMIDLIAAADTEGFRLLVGYGTDAWSGVKVGPGSIASVSIPVSEAKLEAIPAGNLSQLQNVYNSLVMEIARITGTPMSYFQSSGQVAAEGTMKQQEIALVSQVKKAQTDFGNAWEDAFTIALRLANAFGTDANFDMDALIETVWEQAESRNDKEQAETLAIKVDKLGVSKEQAQTEMGYDATQREAFAREKLRNQALAIRQFATSPQAPEDEANNQTMTQTENETTDDTTGTIAA